MEIARIPRDRPNPRREVFYALGDDVQYAVLALKLTADEHQIRLQNLLPKRIEDSRPHDDIVDAGLVFQRGEDDSPRGLRVLQMSDQSTYANDAAARDAVQILAT